ncbi:hypothetical protein SAMN05216266_12946 [Amycolatopsis marina]|uniref:Uncharacterized protein n=1 Tax=Amycolatopsis marina TaxID=490629 RepID=A0A1I1CMV8_9PSEU|nr:hypothetical protein [Amycolatopsis marina]SFB61960.1 hypothetical protein SAMN05216266_12946 [Amycolatopsis marina]
MSVPAAGWMPGVSLHAGPTAPAHFVLPDAETVEGPYGREFIAVCGARCFPLYGNDPSGRLARHPRCSACILRTPPEADPPSGSGRLRLAGLFAAAVCLTGCDVPDEDISEGIAAGLSAPPSGGASVVQGGYVEAVPENGCGFASEQLLVDLLQDNIAHQRDSRSVRNGFEQLGCSWTGVPNVPGHDRGGPVRRLAVEIDLMHAHEGRSEQQAVVAATHFFDQKYVASLGWEPFEVAGTDSAMLHRLETGSDEGQVTCAVRHENVLIEVEYFDGGARQESVEHDAQKVVRYVLAHVR